MNLPDNDELPRRNVDSVIGLVTGQEVFEYIPEQHTGPLEQETQEDVEGEGKHGLRSKEIDESESDPRAAYEFFRGKTYKTWLGGSDECVWERRPLSFSERSLEAPLDRVKRLHAEVEEALDQLSYFLVEEGTAGRPDATETDERKTERTYSTKPLDKHAQDTLLGGRSPLELIAELKELKVKLEGALTDANLASSARASGWSASTPTSAQLALQHLKQTEDLLRKQREEDGGRVEAVGETDSSDGRSRCKGQTIYELFYVPDTKPVALRSRITDAERRIAALENTIGVSHRFPCAAVSDQAALLPQGNLTASIAALQQKLKLLEPQKIDAVQRRVQSLVLELHSLQQKRQELDVAAACPGGGSLLPRGSTKSEGGLDSKRSAAMEDWARVEELFQICETWNTPAAVLPSLLRRLQVLKNLHCQAGGLGLRIQMLEAQQADLEEMLKEANAAVGKLQKAVEVATRWTQRLLDAPEKERAISREEVRSEVALEGDADDAVQDSHSS